MADRVPLILDVDTGIDDSVALLYAAKVLDTLNPENNDQKVGINIVRKALEAPGKARALVE